jgi:phosphatidylserine/phosphatidylglycerophosphate/cardiolipin synthase-like enzyme
MISVYFKNIKKELLSELDNAKGSILIAVCWFTDQDLYDKLNEKLSKGISLFLIIHNDYINNRKSGLPFQELINKGCKFYFSERVNPMMHNKFCIIDKKVLITGSYNWTYNAINNSENILIIKNQFEIISAFGDEFNKLAKNSSRIDKIVNNDFNDLEKSFDFDYYDYLKKDKEIKDNFYFLKLYLR